MQALPQTSSDKTFQIVSLDDSGKICFWTVTELVTSDLSDVSLAPNSKIKLIPSSTISLDSNLLHNSLFKGFEIPRNFNSEIFVCCGNVIRKSRSNDSLDPSAYFSSNDSILLAYNSQKSHDNSRCISFHPILDGIFIVGYSNGKVCLFSVEGTEPIFTWSIPALDLVKICWSNIKHSVFTILSIDSVFLFDLLIDDSKAIHSFKVGQSESLSSISTSYDIFLSIF